MIGISAIEPATGASPAKAPFNPPGIAVAATIAPRKPRRESSWPGMGINAFEPEAVADKNRYIGFSCSSGGRKKAGRINAGAWRRGRRRRTRGGTVWLLLVARRRTDAPATG